MTAQENLKLLFDQINTRSEEFPREDCKIFMNNSFACYLEREMGISDVKASGIGGYKVDIGPFADLHCYNTITKNTVRVNFSYRTPFSK